VDAAAVDPDVCLGADGPALVRLSRFGWADRVALGLRSVWDAALHLWGSVFIKGAIAELAGCLPGMMTLISLAISVAFGFSLAVTFGFPGTDLWWERAALVTIMLLGHWIEIRSVSRAQGAMKELAKLLPDKAVRIVGERCEEVGITDLRDGDLLLIRPGATTSAGCANRRMCTLAK
jgi:Cu2+-exporting ATPase